MKDECNRLEDLPVVRRIYKIPENVDQINCGFAWSYIRRPLIRNLDLSLTRRHNPFPVVFSVLQTVGRKCRWRSGRARPR